ncbi:secreted protein [Melampsora americana]|nr:secreted protein [Melampsora americana]
MNLHLVSLVLIILLSISDLIANPIPVEYTPSTQTDEVSSCYQPIPKKKHHHQQYSASIPDESDQGSSSIIIDEKFESSNSSDQTEEVEHSVSKTDETVQSTTDSTVELNSNIKQKLSKEKYARPPPYKRDLVKRSN